MKAQLMRWTPLSGWTNVPDWICDAGLVLYFGPTAALESGQPYLSLRSLLPKADILGCSTGTQIIGKQVEDDLVTAVALHFSQIHTRCFCLNIASTESSEEIGEQLANALFASDLGAVLVLSDGLHVNGTRLVKGLSGALGNVMPIFGGLAGDGANFQKTLVGLNSPPSERQVAVIGFYGSALRVSQAAAGGWDSFGPKRVITSAQGNVLLALDDKPALDLYERYLGDEAQGLPGTALLYPLCIWNDATHPEPQVRTVLSVDPQTRSMTFAGDIPIGWSAQLMRGFHERLVEGAAAAAIVAKQTMAQDCDGDSLALLVSCVGRRLLMGEKTSEEIEAVSEALDKGTVTLGFYSYGEIASREYKGRCDLHNQTMTVALLGEAA
jgi:hypothetical protein